MKRMSLWLAALCLVLGAGTANAAPTHRLFAVPQDLSNQIVELDPVTGAELTQTIPPPFPPLEPSVPFNTIGLAFDGTNLWFVNGALGDTLYRLDPDTGAFDLTTDVFPIPNRGAYFEFDGLAALNGRIYVADRDKDDILEFNPELPANDPTNFRLVFDGQDKRQPKQVNLLGGLAAAGDRLIATVVGDELVEIDPSTRLATYTFNPVGAKYLGAVVIGNEVYLGRGDGLTGIGVFPRLGPTDPQQEILPHRVLNVPYGVSALDGGPVAITAPPDDDGDGVPNGQDQCPGSDLRAFVDTGAGPTSVQNQVNPYGCSIQDYVNGIAGNARNHGQYVVGIRDLTVALLRLKVITPRQAQEMHLGAAHASVGKGPKPKGK